MKIKNIKSIKPNKIKKNNYVDSSELEDCWSKWLSSNDSKAWDKLQNMVYEICKGVTVHFSPKSEEEYMELCHETFVLTIDKIKTGKLMFKAGKAPVFNLLTTTIFRHLYSLKNKDNRRRKLLKTKFVARPDTINKLTSVAGIDGEIKGNHPDSVKIRYNLLSQTD